MPLSAKNVHAQIRDGDGYMSSTIWDAVAFANFKLYKAGRRKLLLGLTACLKQCFPDVKALEIMSLGQSVYNSNIWDDSKFGQIGILVINIFTRHLVDFVLIYMKVKKHLKLLAPG